MRVPRTLVRVAKADCGHRCVGCEQLVNVGTADLEVSQEGAYALRAHHEEYMDHYHKAVHEEGVVAVSREDLVGHALLLADHLHAPSSASVAAHGGASQEARKTGARRGCQAPMAPQTRRA
eukprot:2466306-Alexandrium_andersonii.AAC.1